MRLNRWQRGGIVLSVVWAVVGGIWGLSAVDNPTALQRAFCDAMGQLYARTPDYLEPHDPAPEQDDCYTVTADRWKKYGHDRVIIPLIFGLAPIPIAWLVIYGLVGVVRWIRRGVAGA